MIKRVGNLYKSAYSGLSPATWWLSLVMLVNRAGTMVVPFMTLYLTESKHYPIGKAGMVMALFGAGAICGGIIGGRLTDKLGFYNIQMSALTIGGLLFILLGQMDSFPAICSCSFLLATINDSFRPANATAIAQYSKEENRTRSYSLNRLAINLGWALGGALGGFVASHNYHLLFWIDGLTNIGAALLLRAVLSPSRNSHTPAHKDRIINESTRSAFRDRTYLFFIVLTVLFAFCFFQMFALIPVFYSQRLHLTPSFIGIVMSVNGLIIAMFEMALVFKLEQRSNSIRYIVIGNLLVGMSFVFYNLLPGTRSLALSATFLITIGEMMAMPFMNSFWISRTDHNNRGQYAGLYTVAWSIGQVLGPFIGAQIAQHLGFDVLWWVLGCICIVSSVGFRWLESKN